MFIYVVKNKTNGKRYDAKTKQFIKTFNSITSASRELKVCQKVVTRCLRTDNHLAGGYLITPYNVNIE